MKIVEIKQEVYVLAEVETTKQIKSKYPEFKGLDLRRKKSWMTVWSDLLARRKEFEEWSKSLPKEYQGLFNEIESALHNFDSQFENTKFVQKQLTQSADDLQLLARDCREEAIELIESIKHRRDAEKKANLN